MKTTTKLGKYQKLSREVREEKVEAIQHDTIFIQELCL